jgi:hypothetical protein
MNLIWKKALINPDRMDQLYILLCCLLYWESKFWNSHAIRPNTQDLGIEEEDGSRKRQLEDS